jgi:aminoglycoside phosphotransferase (APT) family kinase protein
MPGSRDWPGRVVDIVLFGGDGYCLLEPLRAYSTETAELLATLQSLVLRHRDDPFETKDLVHFDFNPTNILVDQGAISGVVDWQDPCSGDSAFDLTTLMYYAWENREVRDLLWQYLLKRVEPGVLGVYLAHLILRQVDWSIRHHGRRTTRFWLNIAREILPACRSAGATWA